MTANSRLANANTARLDKERLQLARSGWTPEEIATALSDDEVEQLSACEQVIENGIKIWYQVGEALLHIRDNRLYRSTHKTFEAYCRDRWQMRRDYANKLISASDVIANLDTNSIQNFPESETHIRPLTPLAPDEQRLVWDVVQQTAPDGKVTAAHVKSVVSVLKEVTATQAVDDGTGTQIPVSEATVTHIKAAVTEETYERMQRQETHIVDKQQRQMAAAAQQQARLAAAQTPTPEGKYRCLVIDPPWPMDKIERDVRPNQGPYLPYATMTLDQIEALPIPTLAHDDGCHLYLWCPQRFVPAAIALVDAWGFGYRAVMTWVKPGGMTPFSYMFNTEHVIFATRGNLPFLKKGEKLSFEAPATGHSIKPDLFYQRVALVSPGPRLDMFARQAREGFAVWGAEAPQLESEATHG